MIWNKCINIIIKTKDGQYHASYNKLKLVFQNNSPGILAFNKWIEEIQFHHKKKQIKIKIQKNTGNAYFLSTIEKLNEFYLCPRWSRKYLD